jgi:hypothetical protein
VPRSSRRRSVGGRPHHQRGALSGTTIKKQIGIELELQNEAFDQLHTSDVSMRFQERLFLSPFWFAEGRGWGRTRTDEEGAIFGGAPRAFSTLTGLRG